MSVNQKHPGLNDEMNAKWREAEVRSEKLFLSLAKEQLEKELSDCRTNLRSAIVELQNNGIDNLTWRQVEGLIEKSRVRAWKSSN